MKKGLIIGCIATISVAILIAMPAAADSFTFSTGNPDGLIATLSRVTSAGKLETETADDFVTTQGTVINSATYAGLLPSGRYSAPYRKSRSSFILQNWGVLRFWEHELLRNPHRCILSISKFLSKSYASLRVERRG